MMSLAVGMIFPSTHIINTYEIIYIRADGSIDPSTASVSTTDGIIYTISVDINEGIAIERDNIVLDGLGHTMNGEGCSSNIGIRLTSTRNVTITNLEIRNFWWGIASELGGFSSYNKIINNNIIENMDAGVMLYYSSNYEIINNNISASSVQNGIWIYGCSTVEIIGNNISTNTRAGVVFATLSENNLATENNIRGNGIGILFDSGSNKIFHNNILENAVQVTSDSISYANVWDNGYPSGGNYWSNYGGFDLRNGLSQNATGSDGIGDVPVFLDVNNRDNYPLMKPWFSLFGDANGDGKVDMKDVGYVARRFMSFPGDPLWDSVADINVDGKIDMKDVSSVARLFGVHYL